VVVASLLAASGAAAQPLFLWHATKGPAEVWLLGSVHVGTGDFYPLDPRIEAAFAAVDTVACEIDLTDPAKAAKASLLAMQKGSYPVGETLREHVSAETWQALAAHVESQSLPLSMFERFKPSMAAVMLAMMEMQNAGLDPDQGIDRHLLARAHADSVPVVDLETVEQQIDIIFGQDAGVEELLLAESLAQSGEEMRKVLADMVAAWRAGDTEAISKLITEQWLDDPRLVDFHEAILGRRNRLMAQTIERRAGVGQATWFVVVGAAHLVGEDGVPALLAAAGWNVAQVR
jgi:uncharacterized protein YbaP (TraB family)